ncbi:DgyrCDS12646 [Dimorphilus gyrociliatus]|uniref:DgyrCDS12646 n=1 Tax=Dimorphilus gyrociliatus TaxID=2664684 RepID=A0A7I8W8D6_9ANNE|nr:DgyrCDS12646 [Dimorphilus gyrociliatus]
MLTKETEKKDSIPEELKYYNDRVDAICNSYQNITKALSKLCDGISLPQEKQKKYAERRLGLALHESSDSIAKASSENCQGSLEEVFEHISKLELELAQERLNFENRINEKIITELNEILKTHSPINKTRLSLKKAQQNWDITENNLNSVKKQLNSPSSAQAMEKLAPLEGERDEALSVVEQLRNDLASELYEFTAKESKHCDLFCSLLQMQADYHTSCLEEIKKKSEEIQIFFKNNQREKTFGYPLEDSCDKETNISCVLKRCCEFLQRKECLTETGILRLAPSTSRLKRFKASIGVAAEEDFDVHTVAGALKIYLRELPEPLLLSEKFSEWEEAVDTKDPQERLKCLKYLVDSLPEVNRKNLEYLCHFLVQVEIHKDENKMNSSNIATVMGPNLLWDKSNPNNVLLGNRIGVAINESLILNYSYFFNNPSPAPQPQTQPLHQEQQSDESKNSSNNPFLQDARPSLNLKFSPKADATDGTLTRKKAPAPPSREFGRRKDFASSGDRPASDPSLEDDRDSDSSRKSGESRKFKPPVPNRPAGVKQQKPVSPGSGNKPPLSPKPGKQREVTYL